jgi:hypothetical protein
VARIVIDMGIKSLKGTGREELGTVLVVGEASIVEVRHDSLKGGGGRGRELGKWKRSLRKGSGLVSYVGGWETSRGGRH